MRVEVVRGAVGWTQHQAAFLNLATRLSAPNVFYDHALLGAALAHLKPDDLSILLVFKADQLCGVFPIEGRASWRQVPLRTARLWKHVHCFNCTPLIATGTEDAVIAAALGWLRHQGYRLLECAHISLDGPIVRALRRATRRPFELEAHRRALFIPKPADPEAYLRTIAPRRSQRKEWRRQKRRLADHGKVDCRLEHSAASAEIFLHLEASGWKGRSATAIATRSEELAFCRAAVQAAAAHKQLEVRTLWVADTPVATELTFTHAGAGFAFKTAYDEAYAPMSPGVLLELETIKARLLSPRLDWVDSCAAPDHPMIDRLWPHRRRIGGVLLGLDVVGTAFVRSAPALQGLQRKLRQK